MIRFLYGRPGSGKTARLTEELSALCAKGESPVYLIVPEQQAYSAERDFLAALPPSAGRRLRIVSFTRLCDAVADLYGGRVHQPVTRAMASLLMWENLRQLTGMLETYGRGGATDTALCEKMLRTSEELRVNGVTAASLERASDRLPAEAPLRAKLRDIALVTAAYNRLLDEVYGENPADRLLRAAERMDEHSFFKGSAVLIHSFSSFTHQEYAILRLILRDADHVTVTFDCEGLSDRQPHLVSLRDTVRRLMEICDSEGRDYSETVLRPTDGPAYGGTRDELSALSDHLWDFDLTPENLPSIPEEGRGQIHLVTCPTLYDEAEAAALHILELNRLGVPFGEMAVVVRDTALWDGVLDEALARYGIPFFLSRKTDLNHMPAARLLLTALRCISRRYQIEDITALCKTGLLGLSSEDLDSFLLYTDTWHLSGRRMTEENWSMNPDGYQIQMSKRAEDILAAANRVRYTVMTPLLDLEVKLRGAGTVREQCSALYEYLCALSVREQLTGKAEEHLSVGQVREAGEQVRLWSFLTETLATVASVMTDAEPLTADELYCALTPVFSKTDIGSIPSQHDSVTVGSASTLRVDHISAMLVLGLCEGEFPQNSRDEGLLTEQDKETLAEMGIELADRAERLTSEELLYVWRTFTKPRDTLILSHSTSTPDGQTRAPSAPFSRVRYLFPYLRPTRFSSDYLAEEAPLRHRTPTDDRLPRPAVRRLLGEEIWLSQSSLHSYARCPYSYYTDRILALRSREEASFGNLHTGNFIHHVMEKYLRIALDEENRIRPLTDGEITEIAEAVIEAYIRELCGGHPESGRLVRLLDRLRGVCHMLIRSIQAELSQSRFTVAGMEWDTHGRKPEDPRPMVLCIDPDGGETNGLLPVFGSDKTLPILGSPDDDEAAPIKLLMGGRIDRVDIYRADDGETVYVRVIDYKSSRHELTLRSVTEDMNIQLLLYLFTLCSPQNRALFADGNGNLPTRVLPASAVYVSPDESDKEGTLLPCRTGIVLGDSEVMKAASADEEMTFLPSVRRAKNGAITVKGMMTAEEMAELETTLRDTVTESAAVMYSGNACRTPSQNACAYCPVRTACGVCQAE